MTSRKLWGKKEWHVFSDQVKARDGFKCVKCLRVPPDVTLQVHHVIYIHGQKPWEYAISDCLTLCKGCHAREHGLIEPDKGWILLEIFDLGDLVGVCERAGCGQAIRYEQHIYHADWGHKIVGSTCVEYLTREDQILSASILKIYKKISLFVHNSEWFRGITRNGKKYLEAAYNHNYIRIYGDKNNYAYQVIVRQSPRMYLYNKPVRIVRDSIEQVKELAFIAVNGITKTDEKEKEVLRGIYRSLCRGITRPLAAKEKLAN